MEEMTWKEIENAASGGSIVALIIGSTEQHGPHQPLGTDTYIPLGIAERVASEAKLIIAPPIAYGYYSQVRSGGAGEYFPGTTSLKSSTLTALIADVVEAFIKHGFKKFLILIGHYENYPLASESVQNAIKSSNRNDIRALIVNWWELIPTDVLNAVFDNKFPGWEIEHAAIAETSILMALRPELVRTKEIRDESTRRLEYDIIPAPTEIIPKKGVPSRVSPASKEKGERLLSTVARRITEILREQFAR